MKTNGQKLLAYNPTPLWPQDDLEKWRKEIREMKAAAAKKEDQKKKNMVEQQAWKKKKEKILGEIRELREKIQAKRPKKKGPKSKKREPQTVGEVKPRRQFRFGQVRLIDDLLAIGKTAVEIEETIKEKIPEYPSHKIMKLIKLRKYHLRRRKS